jgi:thiamine pyrophosphokinase
VISKIVRKLEPITLVGGAAVNSQQLERAIVEAPTLVAADGGAAHIVRAGRVPEAVIGDMDSLSGDLKAALPKDIVHEIEEQDSTDFEKCMLRIETPLVVGLGFLGGRLDHQLAAFHGLMQFQYQRCVLLGSDEVVFLCPPLLDLPLSAGTPVSLFPLGPVTGRASGLRWSFESLDFSPGENIGTSNVADGAISLAMTAPAMLCILPAQCFEAVVKALVAQSGSWPARG